MAELSPEGERQLKQAIANRRCSICRRTFDPDQVRVAARHDQLWIVSVRCSRCRHQGIFHVKPRKELLALPIQDTTEEEDERFSSLPPVDFDDVLDMHLFLEGFDGDFAGLFVS
jgi:RNase P subunit RPR2